METLRKTPPAEAIDRVEGKAKVTGSVKYADEYNVPGVHYGVLVPSTITKRKIRAINTEAAAKAPGVVAIVSHLNRPNVPGWETQSGQQGGSRVQGKEFIDPTKGLYNCPNMEATYRLVSLDMSTPCWTRGPGETSGSFALESAVANTVYHATGKRIRSLPITPDKIVNAKEEHTTI